MGLPGQWESKDVTTVIEQVVAACNRHGKACGIALGDIELSRQWKDKGMRMLCAGSDTSTMLNGFTRIAQELGG